MNTIIQTFKMLLKTNNNITQRQVFILISALIILTFAPQLLTNITTSGHLYLYSLASYLTAIQITLATLFLSLLVINFLFFIPRKKLSHTSLCLPFSLCYYRTTITGCLCLPALLLKLLLIFSSY